jgi:PKD repeat protein
MKKILLLTALMTAMTVVMAQPVQRDMVILEKGSGTWCVWCPSAAQGCEDLLEAGAPIAVVSNQNGDQFANQYSNARNAMYQITGYPTAVFDGYQKVIGGSTSGTTAGMYAPVVMQHMAQMCPVMLEIDVTNTGLNYTVTLTLTKLDNITAADLRLVFFVTESHIPCVWFSQTEVNHVNRLMVPDAQGTPISFTSGNVQTVVLNFALDPTWVRENCEFIVCVQNADAGQSGGAWVKNILNGMKRGVIDLIADFEASATNVQANEPVTFTSEYAGGYIGPVPVTFHWEFPGAVPDTSNLENPVVIYTESGYHDVIMTINKGGQILTITKPDYIYVEPGIGIPDASKVSSLRVFPNPTQGSFQIELLSSAATTISLDVVTTLNASVYHEQGISVNGRLLKNLNLNLESGVYFVRITEGTRKQVAKLVVL